jgi:hypothetical protein
VLPPAPEPKHDRNRNRKNRKTATATATAAVRQVAEVLVAALLDPAARGRVVEIVASPAAAPLPREKWFSV